ncbi:hypothetical protein [Ensifer sp. LCM 4579]|uniref:hypothetical protein n=1 Tax=Ensifer sp. LCM 4579 TaxID=1848292 RepID=UPI0008D9AA0D|nr:hypothetical protein [Ensifer sp. LCM 4579]OHV80984.1 hypothetical protein LCM4579_21155 [Ensifer sp. LCM 4579]
MSPADQATDGALAEARRRGFEPRDAPPRGVVYAAIGLIAGVVLSAALVAALLALLANLREPELATPVDAHQGTPPEPRLQVSPLADRIAIESAARAKLTGYAWVDREAHRVRIPIRRAMEHLSRQGWPRPENEGAPQP